MARYNEINIGRWNRFIQKLTGMKGSPPAPTLAGDIGFYHPLFHGVENRFLESWLRFGLTVNVPSSPAQNSVWRFRNPAGSNVIAVLEKLTVQTNVQDTGGINLETQSTPALGNLTTQQASTPLDHRLNPSSMSGGGSNCIVSFANNIVATTQFLPILRIEPPGLSGTALTAAEVIVDESQELTCLPGQIYQLTSAGLAELVIVGCWWRERFLEEAERA